jgi:hypothetical protein
MIESSRVRWTGHKANLEITINEYCFFPVHRVVPEYLGDLNVDGKAFEKLRVWFSTVFN